MELTDPRLIRELLQPVRRPRTSGHPRMVKAKPHHYAGSCLLHRYAHPVVIELLAPWHHVELIVERDSTFTSERVFDIDLIHAEKATNDLREFVVASQRQSGLAHRRVDKVADRTHIGSPAMRNAVVYVLLHHEVRRDSEPEVIR